MYYQQNMVQYNKARNFPKTRDSVCEPYREDGNGKCTKEKTEKPLD